MKPQHYLQLQLNLTQSKQLPVAINTLILAHSQIQPISMLIISAFAINTFRQTIVSYAAGIVRFDLLLVQLVNQTLFYIPLAVQILDKVGKLFILIIYRKANMNYSIQAFISNNPNLLIQRIVRYLQISNALNNDLFTLMFLSVTIICLKNNLLANTNAETIIHTILALITLIMLLFDLVIKFYIGINYIILGMEELSIGLRQLLIRRGTILIYITEIAKIFQIILYTSLASIAGIYIQQILILFIVLANLIEIHNYNLQSFQRYISLQKFCIAFSLTSNVYIFELLTVNSNLNDLDIMVILITILLFQILDYNVDKYQYLFDNQKISDNIHKHLKAIILLTSNEMDNTWFRFHYRLILNIHRQSCDNLSCFCYQKQSIVNQDILILHLFLKQQVINLTLQLQVKETVHTNRINLLKQLAQLSIFYNYFMKMFQQLHYVINFKISTQIHGQNTEINPIISKGTLSTISYLELLQFEYLFQITKEMMYQQSKQNSSQGQNGKLSQLVLSFLQVDDTYQNLIISIQDIIKNKIDFYQQLIIQKVFDFKYIMRQTSQMNKKFKDVQKSLQEQYSKFPSSKIQSSISFFEAEILNNYLVAFEMQSLNSISDDKLIQTLMKGTTDVDSSKLSYLIIELKNNLQQFTILKKSSTFTSTYGHIESIEDLMLQFMIQSHRQLIEQFMSDFKSKFYESFQQNFFKSKGAFIKNVRMCFDTLQQQNGQNIQFIILIQNSKESENGILIVDQNLQIQGMNQQFMLKLGFSLEQVQNSKFSENLLRIPINKLFDSLSIAQLQQDNYYQDTTMQLRDSKLLMESGFNLIKNNAYHNQLKYSLNLNVERKVQTGLIYYILTLSNIEQINEFEDSVIIGSKSLIEEVPLNASLIHELVPFNFKTSRETNLLLLPQKEQDVGIEVLNSHANTQRQQLYFNSSEQILEDVEIMSKRQPSLKQEQRSENYLNDAASQISSLDKLRRSDFYLKYRLIDTLLQRKSPRKLNQLLLIMVINLIIIMISLLIYIIALKQDINQFTTEINMIALHADFMTPHDFFFGLRVAISAYQQINSNGNITTAQLNALISPLYLYTGLGFKELLVNFNHLLADSTLQVFFINQTEQARFMKNVQNQIYSVYLPFRSLLTVELEQQYRFKVLFDQKGSASGTSFQVFQFANYFNIHSKLESITLDVLAYSQGRANDTQSKWINIMFIFLSIVIVLFIACGIFYYHFVSQQEEFLALFKYCDNKSLQGELQRNRALLQLFNQNDFSLFNYKFDLSIKEKAIKKAKETALTVISKEKQSLKNKSLSRIAGLFIILVIGSLYLFTSLYTQQQTDSYLTRYINTSNYYKLVHDLRFRSGNVYLYREIFMRWSNFTAYLTNDDKNKLYDLLATGLQVQEEFLNQGYNTISNSGSYLFSTGYIDYYYQLQNSSLCNFIDKDYVVFLSRYCNMSFQGIMNKGLSQTVNFIVNSIKLQQQVNNFTKRVEINLYELEGSQVVNRIFQQLAIQLKSGMLDITSAIVQVILILSVMILLFYIGYLFLSLTYLRTYLLEDYFTVRKFIYLVPSQIYLSNNALERAIRITIMRQNQED